MDLELQNSVIPAGCRLVCGVDEAGRGPLAGPVFAGAVILPEGYVPDGVNDSKKLSEKRREALFDVITKNALFWGYGVADEKEIDELNILNASLLAMRRAVDSLGTAPDFLLIDGNVNKGFSVPSKAIVSGDALMPSIAAASVIAKVLRDRYCLEMDKKYPQYGFAKHKGYPTEYHRKMILEYGPSPIHRKSFLKKILP